MKLLLTTLVVLLVLAVAGAAGATSRSGLHGTFLLDPSSPVCKAGTPCSRPLAHALLRFWRNGRLVAHTRTDGHGRYRVALRPRTYTVTSSSPGELKPGTVAVATDQFRRVIFRLDAGIR